LNKPIEIVSLGTPVSSENNDSIPLLRRSFTGLHDTTPRENHSVPSELKTLIVDSPKRESLINNNNNNNNNNNTKKLSGWEKTQQIVDDEYSNFDATIRNLCKVKEDSQNEVRNMRSEIDKEEQLLRNLQIKLSDQEKEQHKLAEQEEFEKADVLSSAIEKLRIDIDIHQKNIQKLNSIVDNAEKKLSQASLAHESAVIKVINSLQDFSSKIVFEKTKIIDDSKERHDREDSRLKSEEDRISLEQKHVEKAEEVLNEELRTTEDAIQAQSGDAVTQEAELNDKLAIVAMEIDALEAQLSLKREEEKKLKIEMTSIQGKVLEIRKKYDRQLKNIKERKDVIETNKYECQKEKNLLDKERASLDKDIEHTSKLIEEMNVSKESVDYDIQIIGILQKAQNSNLGSISTTADKATGVYDEFKRALSEASIMLSDAIVAQSALTKKIESLGAENKDIDDKIPKLETEKKAHAAAKRFKEAAAVAKDIQTLKSKQEDNSKEIDEITAQIPNQADIIFNLRQKEVEAKAKLLAAQKDEDINHFTKLRKRVKELQVAKRTILNISKPVKLKDACICSIDAELNGVLAEATIIKAEHGLTESLEDIDDDEDDEDNDNAADTNVGNVTTTNNDIVESNDIIPTTDVVIEDNNNSNNNNDIDNVVETNIDVDESETLDTNESAPATNDQDLEQAKYLLQVITETEKLLTTASESEQYEDAAIYQEKLEELLPMLQEELIKIKLTEEDVRKLL